MAGLNWLGDSTLDYNIYIGVDDPMEGDLLSGFGNNGNPTTVSDILMGNNAFGGEGNFMFACSSDATEYDPDLCTNAVVITTAP